VDWGDDFKVFRDGEIFDMFIDPFQILVNLTTINRVYRDGTFGDPLQTGGHFVYISSINTDGKFS
jgi:hypothetical protein